MKARIHSHLVATLTLLLGCFPAIAAAAPTFTWDFRSAGAWISTGAELLQDQDTAMADPANLNAQVADEGLFAMAYSHLGTDIQHDPSGLVTVTVHAFADLADKALNPPVPVASRAWTYFQLDIALDQPMTYVLAVNDFDVSGMPGVTTYEHFLAFNDPEADGLLAAGQHVQLYGAIDHLLSESAGLDRAEYPGMFVSLTLAPVPEPETWALMLAGLGLAFFASRRR